MPTSSFESRLASLRTSRHFRLTRRQRRWAASGLAALAVATGLSVLAPNGPATDAVAVVARQVSAGATLTADDIRIVNWPRGLAPTGSTGSDAAWLKQIVAAPMAKNEPLTPARIVGPALIDDPTLVAAPIRVADPSSVALVRVGDVVDVLSAGTSDDRTADIAAAAVRIVAIGAGTPSSGEDSGGLLSIGRSAVSIDNGAVVVAAVTPSTARDLAAAAVRGRLSLVVHGHA